MNRTAQIMVVASAMLATIGLMRAAYGQTLPPVPATVECRQTWEHLMECRDKRTLRVVSVCRKNNVTNRWECQPK